MRLYYVVLWSANFVGWNGPTKWLVMARTWIDAENAIKYRIQPLRPEFKDQLKVEELETIAGVHPLTRYVLEEREG